MKLLNRIDNIMAPLTLFPSLVAIFWDHRFGRRRGDSQRQEVASSDHAVIIVDSLKTPVLLSRASPSQAKIHLCLSCMKLLKIAMLDPFSA